MPRDFFYLEGTGSLVSDNFEWQRCRKAVFVWEALGHDNFIVILHRPDPDQVELLVNEISPLGGESLQPLAGGIYYLHIEKGPQEGWWIKGECRD